MIKVGETKIRMGRKAFRQWLFDEFRKDPQLKFTRHSNCGCPYAAFIKAQCPEEFAIAVAPTGMCVRHDKISGKPIFTMFPKWLKLFIRIVDWSPIHSTQFVSVKTCLDLLDKC